MSGLPNDCFALPPGTRWTPVPEALARLRARLAPVTGVERVALAAAGGRVLAEDLFARRDNPPADNAAVDGYALRTADLEPGGGRLRLLPGRAAAGAPYAGEVGPGEALRILTGAVVPAGADVVVMQEDVTVEGGVLHVPGRPEPGRNIRRTGEDLRAGARVLEAGTRLDARHLGLLAVAGLGEVAVRRPLRVAVLSTGSELRPPGRELGAGQIHDANRPMIAALAARWGHEIVDLGLVEDDRAAIMAAIDRGAAEADVILTSGGASTGDEDHVSALLESRGEVTFWRVAMKPGRPLALGLWRGRPLVGLPGNPVAAFVTALIFARPLLAVLAGERWPEPRALRLPAGFAKRFRPGRRNYLRARLDEQGRVVPFRSEGSGLVSGLVWAEGLCEIGEAGGEIAPGDPVRFLPWSAFGL